VNTVARSGYEAQCPNVARLFKQLTFNVDLENGVITEVLDKKANLDLAATDALKRHPELLKTWLDGVNTASGANGLQAVQTALGVK
jgi:glycine betaine/proline transport system substrate-binding protein